MKGRDYTYLGTACLLLVFWLIMVSELSSFGIVVGSIASIGIVYLFSEHLLTVEYRFPLIFRNIGRLIIYIGSLIYEIIIANIQVAKIVLSINMDLSPTFVRFKGKLNTDTSKAILGNSITLTPGTLTVEIEEDEFIIHGLTKSHVQGLLDWYMIDYLVKMEEEGKHGR
ncbi:Na+/H+ antiporter subunit E [Natranaerobius thermophilus]|uniref:Cation antiporter n=1 Tax=Natranaerobius thermophilus (strain ATCC BAA-1301 / DSM 18059 / JW/NM-WN-LF) TaxID=457570 RepID=B2A686_NATTJ|nr:Na+/H+ antiporter subunit E [Natranaerobius thermophilus]ACB84097.1 cation antiporter [Natranaerobius thermophilus JW/NM-WN-LF]